MYLLSDYGIYLQPNAAFSYDTNKKHTLLISCDDGKNTAATGYFFVHLQKNHPPRFVNLPGKHYNPLASYHQHRKHYSDT